MELPRLYVVYGLLTVFIIVNHTASAINLSSKFQTKSVGSHLKAQKQYQPAGAYDQRWFYNSRPGNKYLKEEKQIEVPQFYH